MSSVPSCCSPKWKYSNYFTYFTQVNKNIIVKCRLCPGEKKLSTAVNSTSNLLKHLKSRHRQILMSDSPSSTKTAVVSGYNKPRSVVPIKQTVVDSSLPALKGPESDHDLKRMIAAFIVEEMLPLRIIESPSFRRILHKIPAYDEKESLPDRKLFSFYLDRCYSDMEVMLTKTFEGLEYICTTADIWTSNNQSFLGMTAHWIDPSSFARGHAAIACKRVKGKYSYDIIAKEINHIHSVYGLNSKVTLTLTDNGIDFIKGFKIFEKLDSDDESEEHDKAAFTDMNDLFSAVCDGQISLPPQSRNASHTLNLVFQDVDKWLKTNELELMYKNVISKCSTLWIKANCSSVASDILANIFSKKLLVPSSSGWNSYHDALCGISEIPVAELNAVCAQLKAMCFTDQEHLFLKEYCTVLKPLLVALSILQGEENCYFGTLLPTLEILMSRILALKVELTMTTSLPDVIVQAVRIRFSSLMDNKEALLAAVTLPKFKLRWISDEEKKKAVKELLTMECRGLSLEEEKPNHQYAKKSASSTDDFFSFEEEDHVYSAETEVVDYLKSSGSELSVLSQFPRIKAISLRYNTAIPSSAPVGRLFNVGGFVLTPSKTGLSDKHFERQILMRYNKLFISKEIQSAD